MKKSVYSLVLSDNVVRAIDDLAYKMGTNRSNLINSILAEKVCYKTPEQEIRDIFDYMKSVMDESFQLQSQTSDAMLSFRSQLRYKYRPTIRYEVKLLKIPDDDGTFGLLAVSFRTQSEELLGNLDMFFTWWEQFEKELCDKFFEGGVEYISSSGKHIRKLKVSDKVDNNSKTIGKAINDYVNLIDIAIKEYFSESENPFMAMGNVRKRVLSGVNNNIIII